MFTPDGEWKEFGIGKGNDTYTTFPFWMFCIVWAFISYGIVLAFQPKQLANIPNAAIPTSPVELPKGYYALNKKATALSGVHKYVYLGPEEPSS